MNLKSVRCCVQCQMYEPSQCNKLNTNKLCRYEVFKCFEQTAVRVLFVTYAGYNIIQACIFGCFLPVTFPIMSSLTSLTAKVQDNKIMGLLYAFM